MNLFLTSSTAATDQAFSEAIGQAIGGLMTLMGVLWIIGVLMLVGVVAIITWVVKKVWYAGSNRQQRHPRKRNRSSEWEEYRRTGTVRNADFAPKAVEESDDWLIKAQARQNARFENTRPPARPQKQSPTGWTFNEKTQLWEPPKSLSAESKRRWSWDKNKQIWKDNDK